MNRAIRVLTLLIAIIGAIGIAVMLGMWLMHWSMMGGDLMHHGGGG
jgi:hypothetical protein